MRVLAVTYALNPYRGGSEAGRAWNWIKQISRRHEMWVITGSSNKRLISSNRIDNVHFYLLGNNLYPLFRHIPGGFCESIYYYWWQIKVYWLAKKLHNKFHFDVAHHITYGIMRVPSLLPLLRIPFIWGPLGGAQLMPKSFLKVLGIGVLPEILRMIANKISRIDFLVKATIRNSQIILIKTRETLSTIPEQYHNKCKLFPSLGVNPTNIEYPSIESEYLKLLYVGRLIPRKGIPLLLKALPMIRMHAPSLKFHVSIVGDGPDKPKLEKMCKELKIDDDVTFHGKLPHSEVLNTYQRGDIFVFPSLREGYGSVLLEAMSFGLPPIVLDSGGPRIIVTDECGIKIEPRTPEQVIREFALAIVKLGSNPTLRTQLSEGARKRIEEKFSWEHLGNQMEIVYEEVAKKQSNE
jgi:glycosyltransferase involved in cell wall biosynthesis